MNWVIGYFSIGVILSVLTWLYYTSKWCKREINEGHILAYLPVCTILWPMCIGYLCYEFYNKLKIKWGF